MNEQLNLFQTEPNNRTQEYWDAVHERHRADTENARNQAETSLAIFQQQFPEFKALNLRRILALRFEFKHGVKGHSKEGIYVEELQALILLLETKDQKFIKFLRKEQNEREA